MSAEEFLNQSRICEVRDLETNERAGVPENEMLILRIKEFASAVLVPPEWADKLENILKSRYGEEKVERPHIGAVSPELVIAEFMRNEIHLLYCKTQWMKTLPKRQEYDREIHPSWKTVVCPICGKRRPVSKVTVKPVRDERYKTPYITNVIEHCDKCPILIDK